MRTHRNSFDASPLAIFVKWLETAKPAELIAKRDMLRDQFGEDASMNRAVRRFIEACEAEMEVREDLYFLPSNRRQRGVAA
ncbi:hypothetical protein [Acidithiobacillus ferridurans]|uniref:Uncharacterized protein n=1 Tax=Acidithiobacillus ferridurans TaxID=1232575 RepID=A0A8X8GKX2_ACIFI|nr:hypothetical protein [Acidithiobacillus ferridurans]MBU2715129.1 hypothetical protein [Acidithiobacillus ferridurans]MBU2724908.1 hypothetical protein [Acidithiobacillus ferridurans]MBU2728167.1 hypothetical protein [Acidithiobacillus ferridurans]